MHVCVYVGMYACMYIYVYVCVYINEHNIIVEAPEDISLSNTCTAKIQRVAARRSGRKL